MDRRPCHTPGGVLVIFRGAPEKFPGEEDQNSSDHTEEGLSRNAMFSNAILGAAVAMLRGMLRWFREWHQTMDGGIKG